MMAPPDAAARLHAAVSARLSTNSLGAQQNAQDLESLVTVRSEARTYLIVDPPDGSCLMRSKAATVATGGLPALERTVLHSGGSMSDPPAAL